MKKLEGKIAVVTGASAETLHIAGGSRRSVLNCF